MASQIDAAFNYNDLHGLNQVKSMARNDDPAALKNVAQQFESMFINMVLKSMREATDVMASEMLSSNETKFYRDMHDQQMSLSMAQIGGYGLADVLYEQLSAQVPQRPTDFNEIKVRSLEDSTRPVLPSIAPAGASSGTRRETATDLETENDVASPALTPGEGGPLSFDSPEDFVQSLLPYAEKVARELGVEPRVLVAQAALETGWGKHMIRDDQGGSSNNFFGIKADQRWSGSVANTMTHEYFDGQRMNVRDAFRAYGHPGESFQDYADFIKSNSRYREALQHAEDPQAYTRALQEAGYATDPNYADKILRIAESDVMQVANAGNNSQAQAG